MNYEMGFGPIEVPKHIRTHEVMRPYKGVNLYE